MVREPTNGCGQLGCRVLHGAINTALARKPDSVAGQVLGSGFGEETGLAGPPRREFRTLTREIEMPGL